MTVVVPVLTILSVSVSTALGPVLTAVSVSILIVKNMIGGQQQLKEKGRKKYHKIFSFSQQLSRQIWFFCFRLSQLQKSKKNTENHSEGGKTWEYGRDYAEIWLSYAVTDNQLIENESESWLKS